MKSLLIAFTLLFGLITPAFADEDVADRAIRCSALIYIELTRPEMSGLTAGEALMNRIYAYHTIEGTDTEMTNGQITAAQTEAITGLTQDYIKGINLAEEYRGCIYWSKDNT